MTQNLTMSALYKKLSVIGLKEDYIRENGLPSWWVNLTSLLDYCWSKAIAVGYFQQFPKKTEKFAGLIQWHSHSPVIILSSQYKPN